eukprot:superscaffoldBa00002097_g13161
MNITAEEGQAFGTMLVAYGYIYPLQNHKKLVMCNDASLYRFQTPYFWPTQKWFAEDADYAIYLAKRNIRKKGMLEPYEQAHYNHLHEWLNHKWDFIVMQATEQYKAGKERKKPDRVVFDCQERAYWIVNRPPVSIVVLTALWTAVQSVLLIPTQMRTFLAPGAPRWINIDGRTMGLTVKGLEHPHRYVLEAAQTHVFLLMKKDTFFRYLKSPVYKDIQKKALNPAAHNFSDAQVEQNARSRNPGIHPIILWQQEEEEKAKAAAASAPVDVKAMMSKIDRKK